MYSKVLEMVGGKANFVSTLNSSMKPMRSNGFELVGYELGEPNQAVKIDNQVFAVLLSRTTMKIQQKIVTEQGSIIAVSDNDGNDWKFVRVKSKESIKSLFPNVVGKLTISDSVTK